MSHVIVWDVETVPDLAGYAAANGHDGKSDDEIRAELGEKFPKHIYHSIVCIGALIGRRDNDHWVVEALGAPHVGERSEKELIAAAGRGAALARARPDRNRWPRGDVIRIRFRSGREAAYQPSKRDPAFHYSLLSDASVWFAAGRVGFSRYRSKISLSSARTSFLTSEGFPSDQLLRAARMDALSAHPTVKPVALVADRIDLHQKQELKVDQRDARCGIEFLRQVGQALFNTRRIRGQETECRLATGSSTMENTTWPEGGTGEINGLLCFAAHLWRRGSPRRRTDSSRY